MRRQKAAVQEVETEEQRHGSGNSDPRRTGGSVRLISGTLPAAAMTFGLFTFMYSSIGDFDVPAEPEPLPELTKITPDIKGPEEIPPGPRVDPIPAVTPPPASKPYSVTDVDVFIPVPKEIGRAPQRLDYGKLLPASMIRIEVDKPAQPITAPNVVYPQRMLQREMEGSCEVRFDLSARGQPFNINANCTHSGFESSATRAVAGSRFSPKFVDGQPVERRNVVYPIDYSLEE